MLEDSSPMSPHPIEFFGPFDSSISNSRIDKSLAPRAFPATIPLKASGGADATRGSATGSRRAIFWEEVEMIRKVLYATLASLALSLSAARAEDTIVW